MSGGVFLTTSEAAAFCGVVPWVIYKARTRGELPYVMDGARYLMRQSDVAKWKNEVYLDTEGLLSVSEAARIAGVDRATLAKACSEGSLSARRQAKGPYFIHPADLDAWRANGQR